MILLGLLLAQIKTVAVLELKNKLEGPEHALVDATFLTDQVRAGLLEAAPSYRMITRDNILLLLQSNGKTLEDCESECEVETGRRLGADYVVTGELLKFGGGLRANLRMHATADGRLLSAAVASGPTPEALEKDLARAVKKLAEPLSDNKPRVHRDLTAAWLAQTSRLWAELRVVGGLQAGDAASSKFFPDTHTVNLTLAGGAGLTYGAGVVVGMTFLSPPNRDYDQSGWSGFRIGAAAEILRARASGTEQDVASPTAVPGGLFSRDFLWTDGRVTLHAGYEWLSGAFDASGEEWSGWGFGFDATPGISEHLSSTMPPESDTVGIWLGGEVFATPARFSVNGGKHLHPKAFLAASWLKYPTGANSPNVQYGGWNAMLGLALAYE